jgi:DNA polymerase V
MWALIDGTNFYCSAERLFDPTLRKVPLCVLSNNDGCCVSRSEEAKALHIKMGAPIFKIRDTIRKHGIVLRSSNYELYADLNRRFNAVIAEFSDTVEIYSIDESFFRLPPLASGLGDVATARLVRDAVQRSVGLPTRVGLGPTRALSKVANALAKASEKVWGGIIDLHDEDLRARMFANWPVQEVWGIAGAMAARLKPLGVHTAADLAALPPAVARDVGTVVLERLVRELNGEVCEDFNPEPKALQSTAVTRSFGQPVRKLEDLREAMVRRAVRAAEKIRHQNLVASRLIVFAHGNRHKPGAPSGSCSSKIHPATNDSRVIASLAAQMTEGLFVEGGVYTKCGVMLEGLHHENRTQSDLFAGEDPKAHALMTALDGINQRFGRHTARLASEGQGDRAHDTRREMKSPSWTTRLDQIPVAR